VAFTSQKCNHLVIYKNRCMIHKRRVIVNCRCWSFFEVTLHFSFMLLFLWLIHSQTQRDCRHFDHSSESPIRSTKEICLEFCGFFFLQHRFNYWNNNLLISCDSNVFYEYCNKWLNMNLKFNIVRNRGSKKYPTPIYYYLFGF